MTARKEIKKQHKLQREEQRRAVHSARTKRRLLALGAAVIAVAALAALLLALAPWSGSGEAEGSLPALALAIGDNFFRPDTISVQAEVRQPRHLPLRLHLPRRAGRHSRRRTTVHSGKEPAMSFPADMPARDQRRLAALSFLILAAVAAIAAFVAVLALEGGTHAGAQTVREYSLEIVPADINYGGGNVWHAWTYKLAGTETGTVPGPTLTATVGEKLVVHVKNNLPHVHSFHTHLSNYSLENDGSQMNVISGIGAGAMIPPGGSYTYEFDLTEPGLAFYHDHSGDGGGARSAPRPKARAFRPTS